MKKIVFAVLTTLLIATSAGFQARAANSISFGLANQRCDKSVLCSVNGTTGYVTNGKGTAFRASRIRQWFQIDIDGASHLKGQPAEPAGGTGSYLVLNDTGRPISLFALALGTDFNSKTPGVRVCAGTKRGKLCNEFTADDSTDKYKAQLSGADWDTCVTGKSKFKKLCIGNPATADFARGNVTFSWRAKAAGAIPKNAYFTVDFSKWKSNAWAAESRLVSTVLISAAADGTPGNGFSNAAASQAWTSDSNNAVFSTTSSNLPGGSSTNVTLYIYNVQTATLTPIPTPLPTSANAPAVTISGDGNLLAYPAGDTAGTDDSYLYNVTTQVTLTLSPDPIGDRADEANVSNDGSTVVFGTVDDTTSPATQLVWAYNVQSGNFTEMLASDGSQPNPDGCASTSTSSDGEFATLICGATNLVPGVNYSADYVWDQLTNSLQVLTESTDGGEGMPAASEVGSGMTPDGRYVAFSSPATDLIPGGTIGDQGFVYDRTTQAVQLVSATSDGTQSSGQDSTSVGAVSSDGRYVVFNSDASNLGCSSPNAYGVYVKDLQTGELQCVSAGGNGYNSLVGSISPNGEYVIFNYRTAGSYQVYLATLF